MRKTDITARAVMPAVAGLALAGAALALTGCAPTQQLQLAAETTGCPLRDITVGDIDSTSHSETWTATCGGQTYYCAATGEFTEVMCRPRQQLASMPAAAQQTSQQ